MNDLISRKALLAEYDRVHVGEPGGARKLIADAPTIEEDHGYWIGRQLDNFRKYEVKCSECGWTGIENYDSYVDPSDFNFCPNCGARMDGDWNV